VSRSGYAPGRGRLAADRIARAFRYLDSNDRRIVDEAALARIEALHIPPAWRDVWISPRPRANLQATGFDNAGRKQYLYHADFRAARDEEKFARLIRFGERLPGLRLATAAHMELDDLDPDRICAPAVRLIDHGWFRVGFDRSARESRTFGITTLTKRHANVRGNRVVFRYRGKRRALVHAALVDAEIAYAIRGLLALPGGARLFRYRPDGGLCSLTSAQLNEYVKEHLGEDFTAKDFRTRGGTLGAAIALAERGPAETQTGRRKVVAAVMRGVAAQLGNTPAVARASCVSPAVVERYCDGVTLDDFRPRKLRVVRARDAELDIEERALLGLLRSWRITRTQEAA
jgi:DNA topoisomerase-1